MFGTINVIGGFLVTDRMLGMFKGKPEPPRWTHASNERGPDDARSSRPLHRRVRLFIYGLMGLTGPQTAVRGNQIAAVGMGVAVVATLLHARQPTGC